MRIDMVQVRVAPSALEERMYVWVYMLGNNEWRGQIYVNI
jgi:hypothetical protein